MAAGFRRKKGRQGETARKSRRWVDSDGFKTHDYSRGNVSPRLIKLYRPTVKEGLAGGPSEVVARRSGVRKDQHPRLLGRAS